MTWVEQLLDIGFERVMVLDAADCGEPDAARVVLALWRYEAEEVPPEEDAWIHPYYFASQRAYTAASQLARDKASQGVRLRDDIRLKPIFARLPGLEQGRNTLSRVEGMGSRFHVQTLTTREPLPVTHPMMSAEKRHACGDCRRCMEACPTGAIDENGFHRERCLRQWMMSGKPVPEELRAHMGNRLIGCDACQRCCPHNPAPSGKPHQAVSLPALLTDCKTMCATLRPQIGVNLTMPNRVLGQACLLAGCSGRGELLKPLEALVKHPSAAVAEHALWAVRQLRDSRER